MLITLYYVFRDSLVNYFGCYSLCIELSGLTVVGHTHREALVESAVLALVAVLLLDFTVAFTLVIFQL